jgi:alkylation response protein AidB-like acyl-CoA dehydrogenase
MNRAAVHLQLVGMVVLWGVSWPAGRVLAQSMPAFSGSAWRFSIACAVMLAWLRLSAGAWPRLSVRQWAGLAAAGAVGVFAYSAFFMLSLQRVEGRPPARCRTPCALRAGRDRPACRRLGQEHHFPREQLRGLAELGCYGVAVPTEWDGAGLDYLALALILEEIAAGDGATSTVVSVNNCPVCSILMAFGNADQKAALPEAAGARRHAGRLLPDRAARGLARPAA